MLKAALIQKLVVGVLGATLASSGLAYAGVPGVPNPVQAVVDVATSDNVDEVVAQEHNGDHEEGEREGEGAPAELPEQANERAKANYQAARDFVTAKRAWTECVRQAAEAHDPEQGEFNPHEACPDKPHPHDFRDARENGEAGVTNGEQGEESRQHGQTERERSQPADTPNENDNPSQDAPYDSEENPSDDAPQGRPQSGPGSGEGSENNPTGRP